MRIFGLLLFSAASALALFAAPAAADPPPFQTIGSYFYRFYVEQESVKPGRDFTVVIETQQAPGTRSVGYLSGRGFFSAHFSDLDYVIDHTRTEIECGTGVFSGAKFAFYNISLSDTLFGVAPMYGNCRVKWHATLLSTAEPGTYDAINLNNPKLNYYVARDETNVPGFTSSLGSDQGTFIVHYLKFNPITVVADAPPQVSIAPFDAPVNGTFSAVITLNDYSDDFIVDDLTLTNATATLSGSGKDYVATLTPIEDGPVALSVAASTFSDPSGDFNTAPSNEVTAVYDSIAPAVSIAELTGPVAGGYSAAITLSEASTDFAVDDLTLTNAAATLTGSGTSYTAVLTPLADGPVALSVGVGAFSDASGNTNAVASNEVTTTYDGTAPTVSITATTTSLNGAGSFDITVVFSEVVMGLDASDFAVTNGSVTSVTGGGMDYVATIAATGNGDIEISIPAAAATDAAGNASTASNTLSITNAVVEKTQKIIAQFMQSRVNQLVSSQPNLTGFLSDGRSGGFDVSVTQAGGNFDFASPPDTDNGLWVRLNGSWSNEDTRETQYVFGALGSHYAFSSELLVGGMVELDYLSQDDGVAKVDGQGWLAGLYVVARAPNHPLFIDGRVLYGQTTNDVSPLGTYTDSFDTERLLAQLKVSGELIYSATTLTPSLQLSYTTDDQEAYTDSLNNLILAQGVELGQAEAALGFRHDVMLKNDLVSLEMTGGIAAIGSSTRGTGNADLVIPEYEGGRAKLKMGANYTLANGGMLALDTFYDGIGTKGYESYGLQVGFNLAF